MEAEISAREKLIVAADDFGLSQSANSSIQELARLGKIDRVAVLVDSFAEKENFDFLKRHGIKTDLHLVLPEGIKKRGGVLFRLFFFIARYGFGKRKNERIKKEWENQIANFKGRFGVFPDGLNSHEYVHYYPPFFRIAAELCKKYEIPFLRFGSDGIVENQSFKSLILGLLNKKNRGFFLSTGLESSGYVASLDWIRNPEKFSSKIQVKSTEVVCHPQRKKEFEIIRKYF